jgi:endonuclease-3
MAKLTRSAAAEIYARFKKSAPAPETELHYANNFQLLVAVVLSAQATDVSVNKATPSLFAVAPTPDKMLALGEERLGGYIKTIGLWRAKAKNVIALSRKLIEEYGGAVPESRDALEGLPGVGRKTANVVASVAFGAAAIAVDTHVFRVANRTGLGPGKTPRAVEDALLKVTPPEMLHDAHHWLILHGRYVCKARRPECWRCLIADLCAFKGKALAPGAVPQKKPAKKRASPARGSGG